MKDIIKRTTDYNLLKIGKHQPECRTDATLKLVDSLKATAGNLSLPGIVDVTTGEILDGHRRYQACKRASVPFYYTEFTPGEVTAREFTKLLNTSGKQWSIKDHLNSYSKTNEEYGVLYRYLVDNNIPTGLLDSFNSITASDIKAESKLDIDYKVFEAKVATYFFVCGVYPTVSKNYIHRALGKLYQVKGFNEERLINKLSVLAEAHQLKKPFQGKNFFSKVLCEAYDYKCRADSKAYLWHELEKLGKV